MASVLIVDDEKSIRFVLGEYLREDGHDVLAAEDAERALAALTETQIDVVVTDVILPRISGVELLARIKARYPRTQVIMMTGEPTVETASEAVRTGAHDYLPNPVPEDAILKAVNGAAKVKILEDEREQLAEENRRYQENLETLVSQHTEALRQSEERYRALVDHSPLGIVVEGTGGLSLINQTMGTMLGLTGEDSSAIFFRDLARPKDAEELERRLAAVRTGQKNVAQGETTLLATDDTELIVEFVAVPFAAEGEAALQIAVRNITQERQLERQLRQSQKMDAIGHLAGGVAHDFNNLLMVMTACTQFIADVVPADSPVSRDIRELRDATRRATDLTRQLLAFSRQQVLEPQVLDLNRAVEGIRKMLGRLLGEDIQFTFEPAATGPMVQADPGQLEQVIMNLAVNARDAMPGGGNLVLATTLETLDEEKEFCASALAQVAPGKYACLKVTDCGTGMTETVLQKVFEPFFTTKERGKGTGLGLATVYGIVRQHGGAIAVESEVGSGTAFYVFLPLAQGAQTTSEVAESLVPGANPGETILFVEDETSVRRVTSRYLEQMGYSVIVAESGETALELAEEHPGKIDLVLTDVILTGMDGKCLADELTSRYADTRILFASGYAGDRLSAHGVTMDAVNFINKPFTRQKLAGRIRDVLDA